MSRGVDTRRVAEVLVTRAGHRARGVGSAYRVTDHAVLTAAHVVRDAVAVKLRFNADQGELEWTADATINWSNKDADIAILTLSSEDDAAGDPPQFGTVGWSDAVIPFSSVGFPRFKLREIGADSKAAEGDSDAAFYRDRHHAAGTIAVLSNSREGTLELTVAPPERDPTPARSPWEGMSGAPVFSGGRLIGLVAKHHRSDGLGRLAAVRIDNVYDYASEEDLATLTRLVGIPPRHKDLVDVVPRPPGVLLRDAYSEAVEAIAPPVLVGRERELDELVRFCAGEDSYQWWRADAWAGKTALVSWFVLHPPIGVEVVSFFVTRRLAGQTDSTAFTEELIEQLAALSGEVASPGATPMARDGERRRMLKLAAQRCGERGERLLLVVDGLDEDTGVRRGEELPSIASLLPDKPDPQLRVLITSRSYWKLPNDVLSSHPVKACPVQELKAAEISQDLRDQAELELRERLHGEPLEVDIIALITAAGGGLSLRELSELTKAPHFSVSDTLGSVFGRSLRTRLPSLPGSSEPAYLFGHETLREVAEKFLAADLTPYIERIDAWAEKYAALGWPDDTPQYVLRPYGRQLAARDDLVRLVRLATDPRRHDRLREGSFADQAALDEIALAQDLLCKQEHPDFLAPLLLAYHRDRLMSRYAAVPEDLPWLWVRLGDSRRGRALLTSMQPPAWSDAPKHVARALAGAGLHTEAITVARGVADSACRGRALAAVAGTLVSTKPDRAAELLAEATIAAGSVTSSVPKALLLVDIARALDSLDPPGARAALRDAEEGIRIELADPRLRDQKLIPTADALRAIVEAYASLGECGEAVRVAEHMEYDRDGGLQTAARGFAQHGAYSQGENVVEQMAWNRQRAFAALAQVAAGNGDVEEATRLLRRVERPQLRVAPLIALGRRGGVDAARYLSDAEQATVSEPHYRPALGLYPPAGLAQVVEAWASVDLNEAKRAIGGFDLLASTAADPGAADSVRYYLVRSLVVVGLVQRAERILEELAEPPPNGPKTSVQVGSRSMGLRAAAVTEIAKRLERDGDHDGGERVIRRLDDPRDQLDVLLSVAIQATDTDRSRGVELARHIESLAASVAETAAWHQRASELAASLTAAGELERAEEIATRINDERTRDHALKQIAAKRAVTLAGQQAGRVAAEIEDPAERCLALTTAADMLVGNDPAAVELLDRAREAADEIQDWVRPMRLADVGVSLAKAGRSDAAAQIAEELGADREYAYRIHLALADRACRVGEASAIDYLREAERCVRQAPGRRPVLDFARLAESYALVDHDHALELLADAEAAAMAIAHPEVRAAELAIVAKAMARIEPERALAVARLADPPHRDDPLRATAVALASAGDIDLAVDAAGAMSGARANAQALAEISQAVAGPDPSGARQLVEEAERTAATVATESGPVAETMAVQATWTAIVRARAALHDWDMAERAAQHDPMGNGGSELLLLDELSSAWSAASESERAQLRPLVNRLVLEQLAGPRWQQTMTFVAALQPDAVVAYREALDAGLAARAHS